MFKTCILQDRLRRKGEATEYVSILSFLSGILAEECLLNARLEHSRSNLVFDIRYDFIFGMLYWDQVISFGNPTHFACPFYCLFECVKQFRNLKYTIKGPTNINSDVLLGAQPPLASKTIFVYKTMNLDSVH